MRNARLLSSLSLGLLAAAGAMADCGGSPCIVATKCATLPTMPGYNATRWRLAHSQIDGLQATNILLLVPVDGDGPGSCKGCSNVNCAGSSACHLWGAGFGDRNGFFQLNGTNASFRVQSWPATKSKPVGPGQTGPGQCLTPVAPGPGPLAEGSELRMSPCSANALQLSLDGESLHIHSAVPTADPLCLGAPPPPPSPPPGRPNHWFSCTYNLAGGPRLDHPFCNASLPEAERLDNLLSLATCQEKSAAITSSGLAIPRLGVPMLGAAEDTHGVGGGCMPASAAANGSTGCPTTFPAGPGLGATFSRELWAAIGQTIGREARGLNNQRVSPLYFLDPDINLLRDPRCKSPPILIGLNCHLLPPGPSLVLMRAHDYRGASTGGPRRGSTFDGRVWRDHHPRNAARRQRSTLLAGGWDHEALPAL